MGSLFPTVIGDAEGEEDIWQEAWEEPPEIDAPPNSGLKVSAVIQSAPIPSVGSEAQVRSPVSPSRSKRGYDELVAGDLSSALSGSIQGLSIAIPNSWKKD